MNFKVRKEYFYGLFYRLAYMVAGMIALLIGSYSELEGIVYVCFILFFAVYFADKEAERKEKVTK